jgi:methyl-accepting chemotaxis protein
MLDESISKVESIVNSTKSKIEGLVVVGRERVQAGTTIAQRCGSVLDQIFSSVAEVNQMVGEISTASTEQAQGVNEIGKAIEQLDQATQQNSNIARDSAESAIKLTRQAEDLKGLVATLTELLSHQDTLETNSQKIETPKIQPDLKPTQKAAPLKKTNVVSIKKAVRSAEPKKQVVHSTTPPTKGKKNGTSTLGTIPKENDPRFEEV